MILTPKESDDFYPNRIEASNKQGVDLATVFCDGIVTFNNSTLNAVELNQIVTVNNNFNLFFNNLSR